MLGYRALLYHVAILYFLSTILHLFIHHVTFGFNFLSVHQVRPLKDQSRVLYIPKILLGSVIIGDVFAHSPGNLDVPLSDLFVALYLEMFNLDNVETLRQLTSFGEAARFIVTFEALHKLLLRYFVDLDMLFVDIVTAMVILGTAIS